ncbi:MAG: dTDP-4-dehydrorhamnose reductase [Gammaproteobacteria bacterium]|nr:dTDP-4-dehydrorhamnose reductase [Gammaproteobacteria bacterium]
MIKILITGSNGQLATALKHCFQNRHLQNYQPIFVDHQQFDITNYSRCLNFLYNYKIDYIINCAAYTAVDLAESNKTAAYQVNSIGPGNLAKLAEKFKIKLIHFSTDYVFSELDHANHPYLEDDPTHPINYYGETKLLGDQNIISNLDNYVIIRAGWLYYHLGKNFFNTIHNLAKQKDRLNIVTDQIGTPTYCADLSKFVLYVIDQDLHNLSTSSNYFHNIYNYSNLGECSWYDFACEIVKQSQLNCQVCPITSDKYQTAAMRPKYSVLDKTKIINTFGYNIPTWQEALNQCIKECDKIYVANL